MDAYSAPPVDSDDAYEAIANLLEERGVYCASDDLLVKKVITPLGHTLYIVVASNGIERALADAIASVLPSHPCGGYGAWVLRQNEARELVRNAGVV